MESLRIILLAVAGAIVYGLAQDQVTARVCVEYFTIGHPPVFHTSNPTLLALGWGVLATWWAGLLIGVPLALYARLGGRPRLGARDLLPSVGALLGVMALLSLSAGVLGYHLASSGSVRLVGPLANRVPPDRQVLFLADGFAHDMAYASGFLGGVVLCVRAFRRRARPA